jgi:hypothetical protein
MAEKKKRVEIPEDIAAEAQFLSDRTCCVCNERRKPIQLHHIDGDPSNSAADNLAVLCFDCHDETQLRGGFGRKLDVAQVKRYKADWLARVKTKRVPDRQKVLSTSAKNRGSLRYFQIKEESEQHFYSFNADYVLIETGDQTADSELNVLIDAFITQNLQRFRLQATARTAEKAMLRKTGIAWDDLAISHDVSLFTPEVLSLEFSLTSYYARAAHPNTYTQTLNFRLRPSMALELRDIFKPRSNYLEILSAYCVAELHRQKSHYPVESASPSEETKSLMDGQILSGASAEYRNFERLSLKKHGVLVHFDPYQVGSYSEGKYEVFVPAHTLNSVMEQEIIARLT